MSPNALASFINPAILVKVEKGFSFDESASPTSTAFPSPAALSTSLAFTLLAAASTSIPKAAPSNLSLGSKISIAVVVLLVLIALLVSGLFLVAKKKRKTEKSQRTKVERK